MYIYMIYMYSVHLYIYIPHIVYIKRTKLYKILQRGFSVRLPCVELSFVCVYVFFLFLFKFQIIFIVVLILIANTVSQVSQLSTSACYVDRFLCTHASIMITNSIQTKLVQHNSTVLITCAHICTLQELQIAYGYIFIDAAVVHRRILTTCFFFPICFMFRIPFALLQCSIYIYIKYIILSRIYK